MNCATPWAPGLAHLVGLEAALLPEQAEQRMARECRWPRRPREARKIARSGKPSPGGAGSSRAGRLDHLLIGGTRLASSMACTLARKKFDYRNKWGGPIVLNNGAGPKVDVCRDADGSRSHIRIKNAAQAAMTNRILRRQPRTVG